MTRRLARLLAVLLVLVVTGVVLLIVNLNRIVTTSVEKGGALVLGVRTKLDDASVRLTSGTVGLDGLVLGSPAGFHAPEMLRLAHTRATVDLWSLRTDEVIVKEVVVDGLEVTFELLEGKTNWGVLMERLREEPTEQEQREVRKKLSIDRLVFKNGKVRVTGVSLEEDVDVPLPNLELTNLSTADGRGKSVRQTLKAVIAALYGSTLNSLEGVLPAEQLKKPLAEAEALLKEAGGMMDDVKPQAQDTVGEGAEKAKEALDDILGEGPGESEE